jgi:hypothetical protein
MSGVELKGSATTLLITQKVLNKSFDTLTFILDQYDFNIGPAGRVNYNFNVSYYKL